MGELLRIAIITNSLTGGGAERAMNTLARELTKFPEFRVALIPINSGPLDLIDPNCEIFPVNRTWRGTITNSLVSFFRFQMILFHFKPKVVLLNCDLPEFFFSLAASRAKIFVVDHSTKSWINHPKLGKLVWRLLRPRTTAVVRVSSRIQLRNPRPKQDLVILNPLPSEVKVPKIPEISPSEIKLFFVGRISSEKDPLMFCDIASRINNPAVIIGDGRLKPQLQEQFPQHTWAGQVPNPWSLIGSQGLLLMTSLFEGDGLVLLEALANNVPVLLRDTEDFRSFKLPDINYFRTAGEAVKKIEDFKAGILNLSLPPDFTSGILKPRDPIDLAGQWANLILRES